MKASLELNVADGAAFTATSGTGHSVVIDGSEELGGKNLGARPMEMVLMGMGGCMGMDVIHILRKSRQDLQGLKLELDSVRADEQPRVFTKVHIHIIVEGRGIRESAVARAIELSAEKYCSATRMIAMTAEITYDFKIVEVD